MSFWFCWFRNRTNRAYVFGNFLISKYLNSNFSLSTRKLYASHSVRYGKPSQKNCIFTSSYTVLDCDLVTDYLPVQSTADRRHPEIPSQSPRQFQDSSQVANRQAVRHNFQCKMRCCLKFETLRVG